LESAITLVTLGTLVALRALVTLGANKTLIALRTHCARHAVGPIRRIRAQEKLNSWQAANFAIPGFGSGTPLSLGTLVTLEPAMTLGTLVALGTLMALGTLVALAALMTLGTLVS
jgi:hypothetical protein